MNKQHKQLYGNDYQLHFLEQYKLCIEMADRISSKRIHANNFYTTLLSSILGVLSILIEKNPFDGQPNIMFLLLVILGLLLCLTWWNNIESYKKLNHAKFKVINEMETYLPFKCFTLEYERIKLTNNSTKVKGVLMNYRRLTDLEKFVPILFSFLYLLLFLYSLISFLK